VTGTVAAEVEVEDESVSGNVKVSHPGKPPTHPHPSPLTTIRNRIKIIFTILPLPPPADPTPPTTPTITAIVTGTGTESVRTGTELVPTITNPPPIITGGTGTEKPPPTTIPTLELVEQKSRERVGRLQFSFRRIRIGRFCNFVLTENYNIGYVLTDIQ
jgi:hypothetical protein